MGFSNFGPLPSVCADFRRAIDSQTFLTQLVYGDNIFKVQNQKSNLLKRKNPSKRYPLYQQYLRTHRPPRLAVWGKNDPFFIPPGAKAFKRDVPNADVRFLDTGHFALETNVDDFALAILEMTVNA